MAPSRTRAAARRSVAQGCSEGGGLQQVRRASAGAACFSRCGVFQQVRSGAAVDRSTQRVRWIGDSLVFGAVAAYVGGPRAGALGDALWHGRVREEEHSQLQHEEGEPAAPSLEARPRMHLRRGQRGGAAGGWAARRGGRRVVERRGSAAGGWAGQWGAERSRARVGACGAYACACACAACAVSVRALRGYGGVCAFECACELARVLVRQSVVGARACVQACVARARMSGYGGSLDV